MEAIHRMQENFRHVLHALSYPGDIVTLTEAPNYQSVIKSNDNIPSSAAFSVMEMVADGEVKIMTCPKNEIFEREIMIFTNTEVTNDVTVVNYIYIHHTFLNNQENLNYLTQLPIGQLEDPELSATMIIEVNSLKQDTTNVEISGPGIQGIKAINLPVKVSFIEWREQMNREFPLGVDIILVDQANQSLGIPRTTKIQWKDVK